MSETQSERLKEPYRRTPEELILLAFDIFQGKVFTSWHLYMERRMDLLRQVFMPLALMEQTHIDEMFSHQPALFYAYHEKAAPLEIDGFPVFDSVSWLVQEDAEIVRARIMAFDDAANKIFREAGIVREKGETPHEQPV